MPRPKAFVLMTAMPPTRGHLALIDFASNVGEYVEVIVCTQPDEPYHFERVWALQDATRDMKNVRINSIHRKLPQEPEGHEGFWSMWIDFLLSFGFASGDYIVASEAYGNTLAEKAGGVFVPFDIDRDINSTRATRVRSSPRLYFDSILPEFQPHIRQTITLFGAESVGKTTLARNLAEVFNGWFLPEWARPYMERFAPEVNEPTLEAIWRGQRALQLHGAALRDKAFVFQDTDLFSTIGYWEMWGLANDTTGAPDRLIVDARLHSSDLYLIPSSNIPFEPDPLRFGGDKRESSDQYWIDICEAHSLNYKVVSATDPTERRDEAIDLVLGHWESSVKLAYQRVGH